MFQVDIAALHKASEELETTCTYLRGYKDTLADLARATAGADTNRKFSEQIEASLASLEQQIRPCASLAYALESICSIYAASEQRVLDCSDGASMHYNQPSATFIRLDSAAAILQEFRFK